ncbi:MAG: phosphoglycerate dehydrogenase [Bdellovibrionota bacterium]
MKSKAIKSKVLVTGALHPSAIQALKNNTSLEVEYKPDCSRTDLLQLLPQAHVLLTRSETSVDREVIDTAKELKVIARAAVGVGNIDIPYATERGILVINTPGKNTNSAAELTMGLILSMIRNLPQCYHHMRQGGWDRHRFTGRELRGKTIGIVGLGNVGHRVAKFAHGFDMRVLAYDPYISPRIFERYHAHPFRDLKEMVAQTDFLSVHVPKNEETTGMIDQNVLAVMKDQSYLINAARGGIVNEVDCLNALKSGKLAGAAIDTWVDEPNPMQELVKHDKCWVSPHIGASTEEAQLAIGNTIVEQVEKALEGGVVDYPVNLPHIGTVDNPLQKPYAILASKIGSMAAQLVDFNPVKMEVYYRGDLAGLDQSLIRLALVKGYISRVVDGFVSFVNAQKHFEQVGIDIEEKQDPEFTSYRSALKIKVLGSKGEELKLGGVVFDHEYVRISLINDFYFELDPAGKFLVTENLDRPGVIGALGMCLAKHQINIDSFDLSRNREGGRAMALIKVDQKPCAAEMEEISNIENLLSAKVVDL